MLRLNVEELTKKVKKCDAFQTVGKLRSARNLLTARFPAAVGDLCEIHAAHGEPQLAEVIGFQNGTTQILPYEPTTGLEPNSRVVGLNRPLTFPFGQQLLGRVINGLGEPIDGKGPIRGTDWTPALVTPPPPLGRPRIDRPFVTGQRVLDGLITLGQGQRVGLFAGSGVGKSTLLGEIAKGATSDVNVIALIGERGREVRPFLDDCLGQEGLKRSVTVVSTADQTPLMRVRAAKTAIAMADAFRKQGANVLLMLDSMTRVAVAQREIGIQLGEPPTARGYTPSVFQMLSQLLEQLGASEAGTITGIVTVLVDGDDMDEPISDAVRSIVDGHVVLDRHLAEKGHFPAINVSRSVSRVCRDVCSPEHLAAATALRAILATYEEVADLIRMGAYAQGSSAEIDKAIKLMPAIQQLVQQEVGENTSFEDTIGAVLQIAAAWTH